MRFIPFKALALTVALGTAAAMMGCAQQGAGASSASPYGAGPYGSKPPGSATYDDPALSAACQNAPAIERDACMQRAKERRSSTGRAQ